MVTLLPFFIILVAGILFSLLFARLHLPWVIAMIAAGIVIGPFGFGILEPDTTLKFIGEVGLIFLMFMAGLEIRLSSFREFGRGIVIISLLTSTIPAIGGFMIGQFFGLGLNASLLLGIIFISSSIAVVLPSLESNGLLITKLGRTTVASTVVNDVLSLFLLSVFLQTTQTITPIPLPLFYIGLVLSLFGLRWAIPKIREIVLKHGRRGDAFEKEVRTIVVILLGTVAFFEVLGLHPITAAFFAGLILSESIESHELKEKMHALSYGVFIPVFFVIVGTQTNLGVFLQTRSALPLTLAVVFLSVATKFVSGFVGAAIAGFGYIKSILVGSAMIPQLSTTLAVVFTARSLGLLNEQIIASMIILSVVTTFIGPFAINRTASRLNK
jgi:Kef-type K+ transport system membrane component KefB